MQQVQQVQLIDPKNNGVSEIIDSPTASWRMVGYFRKDETLKKVQYSSSCESLVCQINIIPPHHLLLVLCMSLIFSQMDWIGQTDHVAIFHVKHSGTPKW